MEFRERAPFMERSRMYRVDRDGEGGIVCELDRVEMKDAPTLLIGLGGTGIDALTHAKHAIRRKMKLRDGESVPGRVAFLGIDTDENQIVKSQVADTTLSGIEFVDISEPNLGNLMANHDLIAYDYERDWLSRGVRPDVIGFGASGVRQFGRFMLIHRAEEVVARIWQAVDRIWGAGKADGTAFPVATTRINVFIFSGVAGGTGSGTFLDMAYLVREAIERGMARNYNVNVYGILYMPAVNECKISYPAVLDYLRINGYAALKELDFWMNEQRGRKFRQQYTPFIRVETNAAPFNQLCFLISPNGCQPADYDRCMKTTGEFIVNILSAPANIWGVQDFDAFTHGLKAMYPNIDPQYSGHYVFASFGMSERRLQYDQVATYVAYYLLHQVDRLYDNTPTIQEVSTFFQSGTGLRDACCLRMDMASLERSFNEGIGSNPFGIPVTNMDAFKEAVKTVSPKEALGSPMLETMLTNWVGVCETYYHQRRNSVVENRATAMKNAIEILFVDLARGPFYAQKMMHNERIGSVDVLKMIEDCSANCRTYIQSAPAQFDAAERNARAKKDSAIRSRYIPVIGSAKYDEYLEAVYSAYDIKRRLSFVVEALAAYNRLREIAVGVNNSVGRFTGILTALTDVFHYNADIITQITVDGATSTWNICNFDKIKNYIDLALQQLEDNGTMRAMVQDFLKHMLEDWETWLRPNGDIGGSLSRFVSDKFSELMSLSLEQFYMRMFNLPGAVALQNHIQTNVLPQLVAEAEALFTPNALYPVAATAINRTFISYPLTAANIQAAIQSYIQNTRDLNNRCDMAPSMRGGSIFMLNIIVGIPMYAFSSIIDMARAYDAREPVDHHLGRHLKMGDKENWYEIIPSVIPDAAWEAVNYTSPVEARKNAKARSGFDRGWPKLIAPMTGAVGEWVLKKCDGTAYDAVMQRAVLDEDQVQRMLDEGAAAAATIHVNLQQVQDFLRQARDFAENGWQNTNILLMNDSCALLPGGITTGNLDRNAREPLILRENMIHTPDIADQLNEQADLYEALQRLIEAHEKYIQGYEPEKAPPSDT